MSTLSLTDLASAHRAGRPVGITSICSAHPLVIRAAIEHARDSNAMVLIEATCNQVNQYGGYTGMRPVDFAALVYRIARECDLPHGQIILGGDHLGPNPWRGEMASVAMEKAEAMIAEYVKAGFSKLHLDASMGCLGEPAALDDETTAHRAARLAKAAEQAASESSAPLPLYIIGTEVPPPGGADHALASVEPTSAAAARETIAVHRRIFAEQGLQDAFARVIGLVVQPGVEFGNQNVILYDRQKAGELTALLAAESQFVFEAHSTDYQGETPLRQLVEDGFPILKVGPELTFVLREALYGLDLVASDIFPDYGDRPLFKTMEGLMLAMPGEWNRHYGGTDAEQHIQRHYSYSDRIRYYWNKPEAQEAVDRLIRALSGVSIPVTVMRQHLPAHVDFADQPADPAAILIAAVKRTIGTYHRASRGHGPA